MVRFYITRMLFRHVSDCMLMCIGDACFLPVAISDRDFKEQIVKRLENNHLEGLDAIGIKIPSVGVIAYQFSPKYPSHAASLNYTRELYIKDKVQAQTLRAHHPNSHYVDCFFKVMKRLVVVAAKVIQKYTEDDEDPYK